MSNQRFTNQDRSPQEEIAPGDGWRSQFFALVSTEMVGRKWGVKIYLTGLAIHIFLVTDWVWKWIPDNNGPIIFLAGLILLLSGIILTKIEHLIDKFGGKQ